MFALQEKKPQNEVFLNKASLFFGLGSDDNVQTEAQSSNIWTGWNFENNELIHPTIQLINPADQIVDPSTLSFYLVQPAGKKGGCLSWSTESVIFVCSKRLCELLIYHFTDFNKILDSSS